MSRSRRPSKLEKCCCGRHLIPIEGYGNRQIYGCNILDYVEENNQQFRKFKELKRLPLTEED